MARQTQNRQCGSARMVARDSRADGFSGKTTTSALDILAGPLTIHDRLTLMAFLACIVCALGLAFLPHAAFADEVDELQAQAGQLQQEAAQLQAQADELQAQVEATAAEYNDAAARAEELAEQVGETQARIDELNAELPAQKERSAQSVKTLYFMQEEGFGLLEVVLASETLDDFLTRYEYMNRLSSHNNAELERLQDMIDELDAQQAQLVDQQTEAQAEADRAAAALADAQAAREQASAAAIAKAQEQVEAEAAAEMAAREREAKAQVKATGSSSGNDDSSDSDDSGDSVEEDIPEAVDAENDAMEQPESDEPEEVTETVQQDDVEWSSERDAFIAEWSGRIDAYLSGSPMAGQGATFAAAAWDSGVDPRWSPAIATVESSTGAICFMPYNAWGWGSYSFGSWEEAIPAHVSYLGSMYGSTITPEAASIYCPPNATFWYNRCLEEMNSM